MPNFLGHTNVLLEQLVRPILGVGPPLTEIKQCSKTASGVCLSYLVLLIVFSFALFHKIFFYIITILVFLVNSHLQQRTKAVLLFFPFFDVNLDRLLAWLRFWIGKPGL